MKEPETTKCKVCGGQHTVDSYRGMKFYVCPQTMRVYIVSETGYDAHDL